ncbi:MAG: hypothetical protein SFX73_18955 [Kofleriaceae bacterium]|nr:hypothetical protein [Kofleriaceae bacterium]
MNAEIQAAYAMIAAGDLTGAEARLEVALRDPSLTAGDRAQAFAYLSRSYRLAGRRADALRTARDASVISVVADDERIRAYADDALGHAAIDVYLADNRVPELLYEGTQALERATEAYQRVGAIEMVAYLTDLRARISTAP